MYLIIITIILIILDIFNIPGYNPFFKNLDFHSFPALIAGLITFSAMIFIEQQNKRRWGKDHFQKFKNEQLLELLKMLNKFLQNTQRREEYNIQLLITNYEILFTKDLNPEEIKLLKDLELRFNMPQGETASECEKEKIMKKIKSIKEKLSKTITN